MSNDEFGSNDKYDLEQQQIITEVDDDDNHSSQEDLYKIEIDTPSNFKQNYKDGFMPKLKMLGARGSEYSDCMSPGKCLESIYQREFNHRELSYNKQAALSCEKTIRKKGSSRFTINKILKNVVFPKENPELGEIMIVDKTNYNSNRLSADNGDSEVHVERNSYDGNMALLKVSGGPSKSKNSEKVKQFGFIRNSVRNNSNLISMIEMNKLKVFMRREDW